MVAKRRKAALPLLFWKTSDLILLKQVFGLTKYLADRNLSAGSSVCKLLWEKKGDEVDKG